jgi:hypothetical protein
MQSLGQIGVQFYCMGKSEYLYSFHEFPESIGEELFLDGTNQGKNDEFCHRKMPLFQRPSLPLITKSYGPIPFRC